MHVIELGSYLAGPLLGKHLVNFGLRVTCVRRPMHARGATAEEERMRAMRASLDAGKEVLTLDLRENETDRARLATLLRSASVLVENFGTGVMERLKLTPTECWAINPKLIYVSLPGYASGDAEFAHLKAWDSVLMASAGVFRDMGLNRTLLGVRASFSGLPMPSVYASVFGAFAVLAALYDERHGEYVEVPLASCLAEALAHNSVRLPLAPCYLNPRQRTIERGDYPIARGELEALVDPFFSKYDCADGRPIYVVCPAHRRHQQSLLEALGVVECVQQLVPVVDPYRDGTERGIGSGHLTPAQAAAVRPVLAARFAERPAAEWERALGTRGVPAIAHKSTEEWLQSEHALRSGLVRDGDVAPVGWTEEPADVAPLDAATVTAVASGTFSGLRVLDMSNVIAGPTIGAMLARMGADVIKLDGTDPTYAPEVAVVYGAVVNVGKRSLLLDARSAEGRRALEDLLRSHDVLIVNRTEDSLARLGLHPEALRRINPALVLVRFDAWGGPLREGAYRDFLGYDDNVQAGIGIMERFGGGLTQAEEHAHIGTIDVIAGVAGAAAAVAALLTRKHRGRVCTARASLAAVGQYLQYPHMFAAARSQWGRGTACRGEHPLHACYETRDGAQILLVGAINAADACAAFDATFGRLAGLDSVHALGAWLRTMPCDRVLALCRALRVPAVRLDRLGDICRRYAVERCVLRGPTYQFVRQREHPMGKVTMVAPLAVRMERIRTDLSPAPKYGAHTAEILGRDLVAQGVASTEWSHSYMPAASTNDLAREER